MRVTVAGVGVSGAAAARALAARGDEVLALDARDGPPQQRAAAELAAAGVRVSLGPAAAGALPPGSELVVTSPGWRPDSPLLAAAAAAGVPVWGEVELAWRLRPGGGAGDPPWLAVTGTNGKTTTVRMLAAILTAAGLRTVAAGNVGTPVVQAVLADPPYDVLALELSSFQLHYCATVAPAAAAVLNLAPDHVDWHGSLAAYYETKVRIWAAGTTAVGNVDDVGVAARLPAGGLTCSVRGPADYWRRGEELVERASGEVLAEVADVRPPGLHNVANALAAAALARSHGVPAAAVRAGLRAVVPDAHRNAAVATVAGVCYVDDSKATNPHAAEASLAAYPSVVWVAGGLLKGADVDELVARHAPRLRAAVLLGQDRAAIRAALARHAADVPVVEVAAGEDGVMAQVVAAAARLARPGDTVLLAPAAASMDMFTDYAHRGDAFAAAVRALAGRVSS